MVTSHAKTLVRLSLSAYLCKYSSTRGASCSSRSLRSPSYQIKCASRAASFFDNAKNFEETTIDSSKNNAGANGNSFEFETTRPVSGNERNELINQGLVHQTSAPRSGDTSVTRGPKPNPAPLFFPHG
jgi:hypothetical protein